jgi:hypothetical protein
VLRTDCTDIQELQIRRIVLHVNHVTILAALIGWTVLIRTLDILYVRKSWVQVSELIQQNLIALCGGSLDAALHDKATLSVLLIVCTLQALSVEFSTRDIMVEIIITGRAPLHFLAIVTVF